MTANIRQADLDAFLDEALPSEEMARLEKALRSDAELAARLAESIARRDSGKLSIGSLWRRHRLSCPSREELGSHLLGVLPEATSNYLTFHIEVVGCRSCRANLDDLTARQAEAAAESIEIVAARRRKFFQTSAGYLRKVK